MNKDRRIERFSDFPPGGKVVPKERPKGDSPPELQKVPTRDQPREKATEK
jgi:hypothetical protein